MALFNMNSGFFKFVNRLLDVFFINLLWILCSLPVVTMGTATCAAFSVTLKMVDDEEGYIGKAFFKAFRQNLKQGTLMWFITVPCVYVLYLLWQIVIKSEDISAIAIIGVILLTAIAISINLYSYPLIARYENSLRNIIKNSFGICLQYFVKTIILIVVVALEVFIIMWNRWTLLAGIIIGPEFIIYTISGVSKKIFLQIEKN